MQVPKPAGALANSQQELTNILREQIATDLMSQVTKAYMQQIKLEVDQPTINSLTGAIQ